MTAGGPQAPAGPLAGVRVLDLSSYIAGPYGCTLLADFGAEVLKVEPPAGDTLRKYPSTLEAESRAFLGVNRGKRGLALDLRAGGTRGAPPARRAKRRPRAQLPAVRAPAAGHRLRVASQA